MKLLLINLLLVLAISCSSRTSQYELPEVVDEDALVDESYLRWNKNKLVNASEGAHKVINCYQGKADETLEVYRKEFLDKNKTPYYWLHIGNCFYSKEEWFKAEFFYRMTLEETKSPIVKSIALNNLGLIQFKYENWEKGKEHLRESIKLSSKFKVPRYNLSQLYLQFGHYDLAINLLNDPVFKGNKDIDINYSLANAHLYKGEMNKAQHYFSQISQDGLKREDVAVTYALYLIRKGDLKSASEIMSGRRPSGIPEVREISDKVENILSQRMKEE